MVLLGVGALASCAGLDLLEPDEATPWGSIRMFAQQEESWRYELTVRLVDVPASLYLDDAPLEQQLTDQPGALFTHAAGPVDVPVPVLLRFPSLAGGNAAVRLPEISREGAQVLALPMSQDTVRLPVRKRPADGLVRQGLAWSLVADYPGQDAVLEMSGAEAVPDTLFVPAYLLNPRAGRMGSATLLVWEGLVTEDPGYRISAQLQHRVAWEVEWREDP